MILSKAHLKRLKNSKKMRGKKISPIFLYLSFWKGHLITIGLFSAFIFIAYKYVGLTSAYLALGTLLGALARDFAWSRMIAKFWPISDYVTDWEKLDELIKENDS